MAEPLKRILVGDANEQRVGQLQKIFAEGFLVETVVVQHFEDAKRQIVNSTWDIILIATSLPIAPGLSANFRICFDALPYLASDRIKLVCVYGEDGQPKLPDSSRWNNLFIPAIELETKAHRQIIGQFRQWAINWSPVLPMVNLDNDLLLLEQVRSLTDSRDIEVGKNRIAQLVRCFFICDKVTVSRLGQGKSGSRVFRIRPEPCVTANPEFVLKLVKEEDEWKIGSEIVGHQKAREFLAQPFRQHITDLLPTISPQAPPTSDFFEYVASTSGDTWKAICYVSIGDQELGQVTDLESVLIAEASKLSKKASSVKKPSPQFTFSPATIGSDRQEMLKKVLEWLCNQWYDKAQLSLEPRQLWETPDALPTRYSEHPPYRFTGKSKERIIAFLDGFDAQLGGRFLLPSASPAWSERVALIRGLLSKDSGKTGFDKLDHPVNVLLSPAHGDLNAANVLLWLGQPGHPFLIDFPFYQECGHMLQDFARLEVELKFMLLDRQADSPAAELPAFDYTPSQMALWLELEEHLLNDWTQLKPDDKDWQQRGHKENVISCLELVHIIRRTAKDIYHDAGVADNFLDEYWAALLYHTLRVLSYASISLFKRLVAVYSASSILEKLR